MTYQHKGNVENVYEKIHGLSTLIDYFINQVSDDADRISKIENPEDVKKLIMSKVKFSRKAEFQIYKGDIQRKLAGITTDNIFKLFTILREVEELFDHDDVVSINFWRTKLYESLIERK